MYTIGEGLRPLGYFSGEYVNEFYLGLTKNLSFFQTACIVMVTLFLFCIFLYLCLNNLAYFLSRFVCANFNSTQNQRKKVKKSINKTDTLDCVKIEPIELD